MMLKKWCVSDFIAVMLFLELFIYVMSVTTVELYQDVNNQHGNPLIVYTRNELLQYSKVQYEVPTDIGEIPTEARRPSRKRGKRGEVRARCRRRGCRVPMPQIVAGNVRSLRNKHDWEKISEEYAAIYNQL